MSFERSDRPPGIETLAESSAAKIERVVAHGLTITGEDDFPPEPSNEFLLLLRGQMVLEFENQESADVRREKTSLRPGDYVIKSPEERNRADWTSPDGENVWVKVSFPGETKEGSFPIRDISFGSENGRQKNIFAEAVLREPIAETSDVRLERVVSYGRSPVAAPRDDSAVQWIMLLKGEAVLEIEDSRTHMLPGDHLLIPPGASSRVVDWIDWMRPSVETSWLSVYYRGEERGIYPIFTGGISAEELRDKRTEHPGGIPKVTDAS